MRQKEVMGQSIRTSKSARPGTITYVPIDKSEFRSTVSSDKKKNKIMKIVVMLIVTILVMSCCVYAGISYYYSYHFFLGTTINGIDSSNKTAYEVEQEIAGKKDNYVIQVSARMQEPQTITGKDIDYQYVSSGEILQLLKTQKPWEWIRGFFETKNYMVQEETVFSREKLEEQVSSLNCAKKENQIAPENAYVSFVNSEFTIVPETEGNELNTKEAYQMICRAIDNDAAEVDLESDPKAYKKAGVTKESSELQNMVNTYNSLAKANITYTFGDEMVTLDGNTIKNWLQFDEKGQLLPDDGAFRQHVVDYVAQLAADHDTVGTERQFETTSGRIVYVYGSAYGWKIDQDKEAAQLMQEIQSGTQTTREPVYSMRANAHGINDLGDTYIEVDLTEQYMWYYQNGNIIFQSEIVSGLPGDPDRKTPPGIFTLNSKSSPSVLRGEMTANGTYSYEQPVTYWMPFNGGIGFHDADWQPYFGGDRYLTGGSHGCINLPPENAVQLYSLIQYDVPIICFY
jgi:lipoprotein-anchoring transpeptidase ErfK/SrfK